MPIDLVKELKHKKIIFGPKVAIKQIKKDMIETIYITDDCPSVQKDKIKTIAKQTKARKIEIKQIKETTEQLQELFKKPFNISVISVLKGKKEIKEKAKKEIKKEAKPKEEKKLKKVKAKKKATKTKIKKTKTTKVKEKKTTKTKKEKATKKKK